MQRIWTMALAVAALVFAAPAMAADDKPLTVNWYHGAVALQPVIDAYVKETGRKVVVTDSYDRFDTDVQMVSDYEGLAQAKRFHKFQKLNSPLAEKVVPARWRDREGYWTGIMLRTRAVIYNTDLIKKDDAPDTWEELADPKWAGKLTLRSAGNVYNRSLLAWMIHRDGEAKAVAWAKAMVANAGPDRTYSGDTKNIILVGKGEFPLAFINTYYLGYLPTNDDWKADRHYGAKVGVRFMDQQGSGQQVNVTGAAISAETTKPDEARALIEWLLSERGQALLSQHVFKYPVRADVPPSPWLQSFGPVKLDQTDLNDLEYSYDRVDQIMKSVGWAAEW